jgi:short-subunit dehydrogenase
MASLGLDLALLSNIKRKAVVVARATDGIGKEIIMLYASHGASVMLQISNDRVSQQKV